MNLHASLHFPIRNLEIQEKHTRFPKTFVVLYNLQKFGAGRKQVRLPGVTYKECD
jgi:hypothetical protein